MKSFRFIRPFFAWFLSVSLIVFCFFSCFTPFKVKADTNDVYYRVITDDVGFFSKREDKLPAFYLPKSYFVRLVDDYGEFLHVECFGSQLSPTLDGYVLASQVVLYKEQLSSPYLDLSVTTSVATGLFSDVNLTVRQQMVFADRQLGFYGNIKADDGETLFFVHYNDKVGYVKESAITPFTIPFHPIPLVTDQPEVEGDREQSTSTTNQTFRAAIIICLMIAGLLAIIIVYKRKSSNPNAVLSVSEQEFEQE
ncbi:MAG: hypothetical protein II988_02170 [Clostridia bacterium]|nr:hypothetical protein [Clostridia bacterium]